MISHLLVGVLGPGDFRSDETHERLFGEFGHSKNSRTFWAFQESKNLGRFNSWWLAGFLEIVKSQESKNLAHRAL